ncbi:MAG: DUF86 domain-containing protein [Deltaproteobacteria bacterium]|nr:DUF86 domain-containing protein [Deltaproteobacteria bacterium]
MKHPERIEDCLQHIAEAIHRITGYVQEIDDAAALERDDKTQAAVIRYIEVIGEAANRIQRQAPEFVTAHPSVPWHEMRGMRNRMIHNYFDVNIDVLWNTVKDDLPKLKQQIDPLLIDRKKSATDKQ